MPDSAELEPAPSRSLAAGKGHHSSCLVAMFCLYSKNMFDATFDGGIMPLNPELLAILACPACRGPVSVTGLQEGLVCAACAKVYPIRDEIPVMLIEESIPLLEWNNGKREAPGSRLPQKNM